MQSYFIKTSAKLRDDGARQYPPETAARLHYYASEGFDSFVEFAGYRAGGTALTDDVWIWARREAPDAGDFGLC